ncbi:MAG: TonB-dependent receptor [Burkholderiales bacterium]|nr:TonB-dependent receptor [Burkholderiales bacterium]
MKFYRKKPSFFPRAVQLGVLSCISASSVVWADNQIPDLTIVSTRLAKEKDNSAIIPGMTVIRGDDIRKSGFTDLSEAIEKLGLVYAITSMDGSKNKIIDLGGFGETAISNTVVYLDDVRLSEPDLSSARLSSIPLELIERIELIAGANSVAYGEGATGGVVRIVTKRDVKTQDSTALSATIGSYGQREGRVSATKTLGAFSAFVNVANDYGDGYRDFNTFKNKNGAASFSWRGETTRITLQTLQDSSTLTAPGPLTREQFVANPRQGELSFSGKTDSQTYSFNIFQILPVGEMSFDFSRKDKESFSNFGDNKTRQDSFTGIYRLPSTFAGLNVKTSIGLEQRDTDYAAVSMFGTNNLQQLNRAVFGSFQISPSNTLTLLAGVRRELVEKVKSDAGVDNRDATAHELGAVYRITEAYSLGAKTARAFRIANANEDGASALGSAFLKTQETRTNEVSLTHKAGSIKNTLRVFESKGENEIYLDPMLFLNFNLDPTLRRGLDYLAEVQATQRIKLNVKATLMSARFDAGAFEGKQVPLVPLRRLAMNGSYQMNDNHRLEGYLTLVSNQTAGSDPQNEQFKVPGYGVADLRYVYSCGALQLALAANNITDKAYTNQIYFGGIYPEFGRNYRATVRVNF